jgi:hypothetical protein
MLTAGDAHQPHPIAQVMVQRTLDAAPEVRLSRLARMDSGDGAHQGLAGHLEQIVPLDQWEQAMGGS